MALFDLVFGGRKKMEVGVVQFDCSVSETHKDEALITEHPVEEGSTMSDHIVKLPESVTLVGMVSNTPIVYLASLTAKSPVTTDTTKPSDRVQAAYEKLLELQSKGLVVTVVTTLRTYKNMGLKVLSAVRDAENGNVLNCTIELKQVPVVTTLAVDLPKPINVGNKDDTDKGRNGKDDAAKKVNEKAESLASSIVGGIRKRLFGGG